LPQDQDTQELFLVVMKFKLNFIRINFCVNADGTTIIHYYWIAKIAIGRDKHQR